jgi:hypothetical protein
MFLAGCLALLSVGQSPAPADPFLDEPEEIVFRFRLFAIPVRVRPDAKDDIARINLFVSRDHGKTWTRVASVGPEAESFRCSAPEDGSYWFAVQVVDKKGKAAPAEVATSSVSLKMLVDTTKTTEVARPDVLEAEINRVRQQIEQLQKRLAELEVQRFKAVLPSQFQFGFSR